LRWCLTVAATRDPKVVLETDARAEHGRVVVVAVTNLAQQVGLPRLSIKTTRTDLR
jgi:biopolymer transport protein ExbD